jgi:hypothetical protein
MGFGQTIRTKRRDSAAPLNSESSPKSKEEYKKESISEACA